MLPVKLFFDRSIDDLSKRLYRSLLAKEIQIESYRPCRHALGYIAVFEALYHDIDTILNSKERDFLQCAILQFTTGRRLRFNIATVLILETNPSFRLIV